MPVKVEEKIESILEDLGFSRSGKTSTGECFGDCILCGGRRKFYANLATGQYHCKAASCTSKGGNVITLLEEWTELTGFLNDSGEIEAPWEELSKDRGLPVQRLKEAGLVYDGSRWVIPVKNPNGRIADIRFYVKSSGKKSLRILGIKGGATQLYGADEIKPGLVTYVVEGEWDRIALKALLAEKKVKANVVAVPGAGTFKKEWVEVLAGLNVTLCYDFGTEGFKGTQRAYNMLDGSVPKPIHWLNWPDTLDDGYDIRDYYQVPGRTLQGLLDLSEEFIPEDEQDPTGTGSSVSSFPLLRGGNRPSLEETIEVYRRNLFMTPEIVGALRVIFAVIIAQQIDGVPLWVHICAPPGGCKTSLLMTCKDIGNVITRSTITAHSLVSGWNASKNDPSLIPRLNGKIFVLKDYTELLDMPPAERQHINGILRGAYDGLVEKTFGNGVERRFEGRFNLLSGVTPAIFRESLSSVGERFLIYHMNRSISQDNRKAIRAAFDSVGREDAIQRTLQDAAKAFLEYRIETTDYEAVEITEEQEEQLISLAQLVAMLRANVERDITRERVLYRPSHEIATRLSMQFKKLLLGLALQHNPPRVTHDDYMLVQRVALDTCVGWNIDTMLVVAKYNGSTIDQITEQAKIPKSTLRDRLEDLVMLGVLTKEKDESIRKVGAPSIRYYLSKQVRQFWGETGIEVESNPFLGIKNGFRGISQKTKTFDKTVKTVSEAEKNRIETVWSLNRNGAKTRLRGVGGAKPQTVSIPPINSQTVSNKPVLVKKPVKKGVPMIKRKRSK